MNDNIKNQLIEDYLNNNLNREDLILFKKAMLADPELAEEVTINKNLFALHETESWEDITTLNEDGIAYQEYLLSDDAKSITTAINDANTKYQSHSITPIKKYRWYGIAASFALLIAVSYTLINNNNNTPEHLYATYSDLSNLPSLTLRSDADKLLSDAEQLFLNKEYVGAVRSLELYEEKYQDKTANTLLYKGICHLELGDYKKAETIFNTLKNSTLLDKNNAYWYLALTKLNKKEIHETKVILKTIIDSSYYNNKQAKELLSKLD